MPELKIVRSQIWEDTGHRYVVVDLGNGTTVEIKGSREMTDEEALAKAAASAATSGTLPEELP